MLLFHGTGNTDPHLIVNTDVGFDHRFANKRSLWGIATYFAVWANYSDAFAFRVSQNDSRVRTMILARVAVGESITLAPDNTLNKPPVRNEQNVHGLSNPRYDSVNGVTQGHPVYMVYQTGRAYPLYIVEYEK